MPKVKSSIKPDAVLPKTPGVDPDDVEIPVTPEQPKSEEDDAPAEACEEDTEQRREAEDRLKDARENEYRKRMDARLARDKHDLEVKELKRLETEKAKEEHLERQRIKVKSTQAARKKAE